MVRSSPVPTDAVVVTFASVIATCAESATLPLPADAPPFAVVDELSVSVDEIVRLFAPLIVEPSGRPAVVVSLTTLRAKEAPTPLVLPSLDCFAVASAVLVRFEPALRLRSPFNVAFGIAPSTSPVELFTTTTTAIEPATPTLVPPAPEI